MVQHSVWLLPDRFPGCQQKIPILIYIYIGEDDSLNMYEHSVAVLPSSEVTRTERTPTLLLAYLCPRGHLLCRQINARIMDGMNGKSLDLRLEHESNQKIAAKSVRFPIFLDQVIA